MWLTGGWLRRLKRREIRLLWVQSPSQLPSLWPARPTATEVYSLGATLYAFFALRPPFQGETFSQVASAVLNRTPESPDSFVRTSQGRVPREVANIVNRALSKDPADRYSTVADLEQALQDYIDGESPVVCMTTGLKKGTHRLARFIDNHPVLAGLIGIFLVAVPLVEAAVIALLW